MNQEILGKILGKMFYLEQSTDHQIAEKVNSEITELTQKYLADGGTLEQIDAALEINYGFLELTPSDCKEILNQMRLHIGFIPKIPKVKLSSAMLPGEEYNLRGNPLNVLESHGWNVYGHGRKIRLKPPGKHHSATAATFNHEGQNELVVYTTNAPPFEPHRKYSPFAIFTWLECNGDFKQAAKELKARGYGQ